MRSLAEAADGEAWIERKSCLGSSARLIQRAKQRQCSGKAKMREGIAVGLDAPAEPHDRFSIRTELQLGDAENIIHR